VSVSVNVCISVASPEDVRRSLREDEVYLDDLPSVRTVNLRRDWDALHYLLTGSLAEGRGPLAFIKHGGEDINRGANQRLFRPAAVHRIHTALSALSMKVCRQRFRTMVLDDADDVYPGSWEGTDPGLLFELIKELKALVRGAARRGHCLVYSDDA
jgi:hypothetical protein